MIKLLFRKGRPEDGIEFVIEIDQKAVTYTDKNQGVVRIFPQPDRKAMSQGGLSKKDLEQYNRATDDEELRAIIISDAKENGCALVSEKRD